MLSKSCFRRVEWLYAYQCIEYSQASVTPPWSANVEVSDCGVNIEMRGESMIEGAERCDGTGTTSPLQEDMSIGGHIGHGNVSASPSWSAGFEEVACEASVKTGEEGTVREEAEEHNRTGATSLSHLLKVTVRVCMFIVFIVRRHREWHLLKGQCWRWVGSTWLNVRHWFEQL